MVWQTLGRRWDIHLRLRKGQSVLVRAAPTTDFWVMVEVFFARGYEGPLTLAKEEVRQVIDLGVNVGYTLLHWAQAFPKAHIIGYEPIPAHCVQARKHVRLNQLTGRVDLREAAAGTRAATAYVVDRGSGSILTMEPEDGAVQVPIVDFFEEVPVGGIDLLKIDIEGGEYALVGDDRFGRLGARHVVMEWHESPDRPVETKQWLVERLTGFGYRVRDMTEAAQGQENTRVGMLWASLV